MDGFFFFWNNVRFNRCDSVTAADESSRNRSPLRAGVAPRRSGFSAERRAPNGRPNPPGPAPRRPGGTRTTLGASASSSASCKKQRKRKTQRVSTSISYSNVAWVIFCKFDPSGGTEKGRLINRTLISLKWRHSMVAPNESSSNRSRYVLRLQLKKQRKNEQFSAMVESYPATQKASSLATPLTASAPGRSTLKRTETSCRATRLLSDHGPPQSPNLRSLCFKII